MTLVMEFAKPRRSRMEAELRASALPAIKEFTGAFASHWGWGPAMADRLEAAAEETLLAVMQDDKPATERAGRRLRLIAYREDDAAVLEFVVAREPVRLDPAHLDGEGVSGLAFVHHLVQMIEPVPAGMVRDGVVAFFGKPALHAVLSARDPGPEHELALALIPGFELVEYLQPAKRDPDVHSVSPVDPAVMVGTGAEATDDSNSGFGSNSTLDPFAGVLHRGLSLPTSSHQDRSRNAWIPGTIPQSA